MAARKSDPAEPRRLPAARPGRAALVAALLGAAAALRADGFRLPREGFIPASYGTQAGLPLPVEDIVQSRSGYLWIATQAGLARFDGTRFTLYRMTGSPGLRDNSVLALCETRDGVLWIGTSRGLSRYRDGAFEPAGPGGVSVTELAEDGDGVLWVGSSSGLWRCDGGSLVREAGAALLDGKAIRDLSVDREGRVWAGVRGFPAVVGEHGKFRVFEAAGRRIEGMTSVAETRKGELWFATASSGLWRLSGGRLKNYGPESGLGSKSATRVFVDRRDRVWAVAGGAYLLGRQAPDRFDPVLPRIFENFRAVAEDAEGDVWLGTLAHGLICLKPVPLRAYDDEESPIKGGVRAVAEDAAGNLWLGVAQHPLMVMRPDGTLEQRDVQEGYAPDSFSVCAASDGTVWSGGGTGLQATRGGRIERFPQYPAARAIFEARDHSIWMAPDGPIVRYRDGVFETMGGRGGLPAGGAGCFAEAADGTLYIGLLNGGLVRWKDGAATLETTRTGLPSDEVRTLLADAAGRLWLGTKGRGLAVRDGGRWFNPQAFSDLFEDQVSALIEDGAGHLFIGTLKGVFYASEHELLAMARGGPPANLHAVLLGDGSKSDAIYSSTQPVACRARDGTLWFGARRGLFGVDPSGLGSNQVPPPVYLEGAVVDGRPADAAGEVRLRPGAHALALDYTAIGFARPGEMLFQYRLEGYDADWVDAQTRRTAYYANLPPGRYRFRVKACNDDGIWNETGAAVEVVQEPWFYQTPWFRALLAAGLCGAGLGLYRWRVRSVQRRAGELQRQNAELERRISERTDELGRSVEALRVSEYFYHSLVESLPQIILRKDAAGRFTYANQAFAELAGRPLAEIVGRTDRDLYDADRAERHREDDLRIMATGQTIEYEDVAEGPEGGRRFLHLKKVPLYDEHRNPMGVLALFWDLTLFRETEEKLKAAQRELIETSRLAGMAEAATGLLHNFGNALTSVNIASTLALERIAKLKLGGVVRVAELLAGQRERLPEFFLTDPRGRQLPDYLETLGKHLEDERAAVLHELTLLQRSVEHINGIVVEQQKNAKPAGAEELVPPNELLEYALSITEATLRKHDVAVAREYVPAPPVRVPRQRALQILVNLIRNAKDSILEKAEGEKRITVAVRVSPEGRVRLSVSDTGMGISKENLDRIFSFGFTTKQSGHGFGLHSSVLAAKELGGSLTAQSPGPGRGATFVLELPPAPPPS